MREFTMSSVPSSVETVNAAATAIVTAESRVQPSAVQKRRWGSCWSFYSCFGSYKQSKKIGHAILLSDPPSALRTATPISEIRNQPSNSSSIVLPFIAPPSSPASFLQSDPPSATYSPGRPPPGPGPRPTPIFTIGPYAHETQLVSPPVFSTFTTEPSTASFTPPPEPVQMMTTPSSPEVPFAQLLSSSLARKGRNGGSHPKFPLSQYDFRPYQYPGSPGGHVKSPGSAVSTSGTSSPYLMEKRPILEFRMGEAPKFLGYEHYRWDSRVNSGSLTPNEWGSRLGSGTLTPNGAEHSSEETKVVGKDRILEVVLPANLELKPQNYDLVDHRVSFELIGEDIPTCVVRTPSLKNGTGYELVEGTYRKEFSGSRNEDSFREHFNGEIVNGEEFHQKQRTISLGSSKDFNFNNEKGEVSEKSSVDCEWWTSEKVVKELGPRNSWSFFPMLQSGAS